MRSWMVALACSLLFGYAGAALADEAPGEEPAAEEAAPAAPEENAEKAAEAVLARE